MNLTRPVSIVATAALAALALAACGGGGGNTNTTGSAGNNPGPQAAASAAYRFSVCMRAHGLPKFPDPVVHQSNGSQSIGLKVTPAETSSPAFNSAQKACQGILPAGKNGNGPSPAEQRQRTQEFVAFAQCLRTHGYTRFPDPDAQGELQPQQIISSGINVHAPGFFDVAKGCLPALKGTVSVADLRQAIDKLPAPGISAAGR